MTLKELYDSVGVRSPLKVLSGRTGKVLARNFNAKTHAHLEHKKVCDIWAELDVIDFGFGNSSCRPIMVCYVSEVNEDA